MVSAVAAHVVPTKSSSWCNYWLITMRLNTPQSKLTSDFSGMHGFHKDASPGSTKSLSSETERKCVLTLSSTVLYDQYRRPDDVIMDTRYSSVAAVEMENVWGHEDLTVHHLEGALGSEADFRFAASFENFPIHLPILRPGTIQAVAFKVERIIWVRSWWIGRHFSLV